MKDTKLFEELHTQLLSDLELLGVKTDFKLVLRKFSKTMYGSYSPSDKQVVIYVYKTSDFKKVYSYAELLDTLIHEVSHHIQYKNPDYKRLKGVMHNTEFYAIYNDLKRNAVKLNIIKRGRSHNEKNIKRIKTFIK